MTLYWPPLSVTYYLNGPLLELINEENLETTLNMYEQEYKYSETRL